MENARTRVLVVEDEESIGLLIEKMLAGKGFEVKRVRNGQEGLAALNEFKADCIVTDIIMPVMTGKEFINELRSSSEYQFLPVMILSALDSEDMLVDGYRTGANDYLTKPFNDVELAAKVKVLVDRRRGGGTGAQEAGNRGGMHARKGMTRYGRFFILARMSSWKRGGIYKAFDPEKQREIVIKRLDSDEADSSDRTRFRLESEILRRLDRPYIAEVVETGTAEGMDFIAMEKIAAPNLQVRVSGSGDIPESDVREWSRRIAEALEDLHAAGVVHGRISLDNVFVSGLNGLKITGFSSAALHSKRLFDAAPAASGRRETGDSKDIEESAAASSAIDVCRLGAIMFRLMTGAYPAGFEPDSGISPTNPAAVRSALAGTGYSKELKALVSRLLSPGFESIRMGEVAGQLKRLDLAAGGPADGARAGAEDADSGSDAGAGEAGQDAADDLTLEDYNVFEGLRTRATERLRSRKSNRLPAAGTAGPDPAGLEGMTVRGYRIERLIGRGGMGDVYLATQLSLNRQVAMKILPEEAARENPAAVVRFLKEARSAAVLVHPNVVQIFDACDEGPIRFIAMEYVEGEDLKKKIERDGNLAEKEALEILEQAAMGLSAAEEKKIVHRDIKPANIILAPGNKVKIADFGLAREIGKAGVTMENKVVGSPAYMAPEQALGHELDSRADIYSLGVTFLELLTGKRPFMGETPADLIQSKLNAGEFDALSGLHGLSPWAESVVRRMIARDPAGRFSSAAELLSEIRSRRTAAPGQGAESASAEKARKPVNPTVKAAVTPVPAQRSNRLARAVSVLFSAALLAMPIFMGLSSAKAGACGSDAKEATEFGLAAARLPVPGPCPVQSKAPASVSAPLRPAEDGNTGGESACGADSALPEGKTTGGNAGTEIELDAETLLTPVQAKECAVPLDLQSPPVPERSKEPAVTDLVGVEAMLSMAREGRNSEAAALAEKLSEGGGAPAIVGETARTIERIPDGLAYMGLNDKGFREYRNVKDGMVLILVPASSAGTVRANRHEYLISKYEVTRDQFTLFLNKNTDAGTLNWTPEGITYIDSLSVWAVNRGSRGMPATGVTWQQARDYSAWAARGGDLPYEAQWEYAALGGDGRHYPWGDASPDGGLCVMGSLMGELDAVGLRPAGDSPFGAADMAGNAYEWCFDEADSGISGGLADGFKVVKGSPLRFSTERMKRKASETGMCVGFRYVAAVAD